jgi:H+/Cl- antiporter ClcA
LDLSTTNKTNNHQKKPITPFYWLCWTILVCLFVGWLVGCFGCLCVWVFAFHFFWAAASGLVQEKSNKEYSVCFAFE